ncbi:hypothetical protein H0X10_01070 [Candidatus Saccharibacteria bacterium]|nr:hypothetical protein [Candidatus Saccharibacteria bacterium]
MQKYVLVCLLKKLDEGTEFTSTSWPLHVTIASNFVVDWGATNLLYKLTALLTNRKPIKTTAGDDEYFGDKKQIHVTILDKHDEMTALHNDIIGLLKSVGAIFDEPNYLEEGYKAHVTVQSDARVHKGDLIVIDNVTVVDMFARKDIRGRKILKSFHLIDS